MTDPGPLSEPPPIDRVRASTRSNLLRWLMMVVATAFIVSSIAPSLPPTWKRLGLMYAGLGAVIGIAAGWLAGRIRLRATSGTTVAIGKTVDRGAGLPPNRRLMWLVLLATFGSLINTAFVSARQHRLAVEAGAARDPQARAYLEMLRLAARTDPESAAQLDLINRRMSAGFREYLAFRFSRLTKNRTSPIPEMLWGCELLLGLLAAGVAFRIVSKQVSAG